MLIYLFEVKRSSFAYTLCNFFGRILRLKLIVSIRHRQSVWTSGGAGPDWGFRRAGRGAVDGRSGHGGVRCDRGGL